MGGRDNPEDANFLCGPNMVAAAGAVVKIPDMNNPD
jgi:hypothetical protein